MKSKIYLGAAALAIAALFGGCAKDGAVGPQGPEGNANVSATTFIVPTNSWNIVYPKNRTDS